MPVTQVDAARQVKDASVTNAKLAGSIGLDKLAEAVLQADGGQALTANLPAGGFKLTGLGAPTADGDSATKAYVDALSRGNAWKDAVRAATTTNGALSTAYVNGAAIDGVTLATGDRILIKDQTTASENGIYTVNATGAPTRAVDADSADELQAAAVTVMEGTTNADRQYVQTADNITVGTTALAFALFGGGSGLTTAGAGLTSTGSTVDVVSANAAIVANTDNIALTLGTASGLEVHTSGLRLARGTGGQIIVVNGTGDPVYAAMSGDATLSNTGAVTVANTITRNAAFVTRETPTGAIDGTNTGFTLANTPVVGSEELYLNGILQEPGTGNDYAISGASITMASAPIAGDKIRVSYRK